MTGVTINVPNKEQDILCDKWIDTSCEKRNLTLRHLHQVTQQVNQQLQMKQQMPPQMGGGLLTEHELLLISWLPTILERIKIRVEQGEY